MSNEKKPGCLGNLLGIILPSYVGISINHDIIWMPFNLTKEHNGK